MSDDPNSGITPGVHWPGYNSKDKDILVLGNEIESSTASDGEDIDFFTEIIWGGSHN